MTTEMTMETAGSIRFQPVRLMIRAATTTPSRDQGIGQHVLEGAADIDVALAARGEEPGADSH